MIPNGRAGAGAVSGDEVIGPEHSSGEGRSKRTTGDRSPFGILTLSFISCSSTTDHTPEVIKQASMSSSDQLAMTRCMLVPELVGLIADFALQDSDGLADRQLLRNRLRLVCRAWDGALPYWNRVDAVGVVAVGALSYVIDSSARSPAQLPVSAALFRLTVSLAGLRSRAQAQAGVIVTIGLLSRLPALEELTLVAGSGVTTVEDGGQRQLDPALVRALCGLPNLRHFTLATQPRDHVPHACTVAQLNM